MTKEENFIKLIGTKAQKDYQKNGILASVTIAQACLESGYGTTVLAKNANNLFGMKTSLSGNTWKTVWDGISKYTIVTREEYVQGQISMVSADFRQYPSIDKSIEDHSLYLLQAKKGAELRYKGLSREKDYRKAIQIIKDGGYATDNNYVNKICNLIERWNLTKYDIINNGKEENNMAYSNSSLADYTIKSPNHSGQRTHKIDRITPHCVVGQLNAESIGNIFLNPSMEASCNYGIGTEGKVCLIVDEANRSWCSSSNENDQRAITIECASDMTDPYTFNDKVYNKLIELCVDICKRNGKNKILWFNDKSTALNYSPKANEMVLTVHRWFANKSCPGDWMYNRMGRLADEVNKRLGNSQSVPTPPADKLYRVQVGAYKVKANAEAQLKEIKKAGFKDAFITREKEFYKIQTGAYKNKANAENQLKEIKKKGFDGFIITLDKIPENSTPAFESFRIRITADVLNIRDGAGTNYKINGVIRDKGTYTITQTSGNWGKLKSGAGWICLDYTKRV